MASRTRSSSRKLLPLLALALAVALPAAAQDSAPFQGTWVALGCELKKKLGFSLTVDGDTTTVHQLVDDRGLVSPEHRAPASYLIVDGQNALLTTHWDTVFLIRTRPDGTLIGTFHAETDRSTARVLYVRRPKEDLMRLYFQLDEATCK